MAVPDNALEELHKSIGAEKNRAAASGDQTAFIPSKPAGPGGEGPNPNPFPTKDGGFGRRA